MPRMSLECPTTGLPVVADVEESEPSRDARAVPEAGIKCPHCHEFHVWPKESIGTDAR